MSCDYEREQFNNIFDELEKEAVMQSDWDRVDHVRDLRYCIERKVLDAYDVAVKEARDSEETMEYVSFDAEREVDTLNNRIEELANKIEELEKELEESQVVIYALEEQLINHD